MREIIRLFDPRDPAEGGPIFWDWLEADHGITIGMYQGLPQDCRDELCAKFAARLGIEYVGEPAPAGLSRGAKWALAAALTLIGWMLAEGFWRAIGH